jgi:quercetin dioxygenase-like cupin family protein
MKRIIIGIAAVLVVSGGIAAATPSRGYMARALGSTTLESPIDAPAGSVALVVRATIEPDGTTGWHSHPSDVVVLVRHGRVALFDGDDCSRTVYDEGEIFIEMPGHVHKAKNIGDAQVVLLATFVGLPPNTPPTMDEANPCRPA